MNKFPSKEAFTAAESQCSHRLPYQANALWFATEVLRDRIESRPDESDPIIDIALRANTSLNRLIAEGEVSPAVLIGYKHIIDVVTRTQQSSTLFESLKRQRKAQEQVDRSKSVEEVFEEGVMRSRANFVYAAADSFATNRAYASKAATKLLAKANIHVPRPDPKKTQKDTWDLLQRSLLSWPKRIRPSDASPHDLLYILGPKIKSVLIPVMLQARAKHLVDKQGPSPQHLHAHEGIINAVHAASYHNVKAAELLREHEDDFWNVRQPMGETVIKRQTQDPKPEAEAPEVLLSHITEIVQAAVEMEMYRLKQEC